MIFVSLLIILLTDGAADLFKTLFILIFNVFMIYIFDFYAFMCRLKQERNFSSCADEFPIYFPQLTSSCSFFYSFTLMTMINSKPCSRDVVMNTHLSFQVLHKWVFDLQINLLRAACQNIIRLKNRNILSSVCLHGEIITSLKFLHSRYSARTYKMANITQPPKVW